MKQTYIRHLTCSSVQLLSCVQLLETSWTAACQASLFITNSWSLLKLMSIESVMPSNHLILWHPLVLLPPIFPSIRVFSNECVLGIRWPKSWSFSFSPSNECFSECCGLISFRIETFKPTVLLMRWLLIQFSSVAQSCLTLWPHELQHAVTGATLKKETRGENPTTASCWVQINFQSSKF